MRFPSFSVVAGLKSWAERLTSKIEKCGFGVLSADALIIPPQQWQDDVFIHCHPFTVPLKQASEASVLPLSLSKGGCLNYVVHLPPPSPSP